MASAHQTDQTDIKKRKNTKFFHGFVSVHFETIISRGFALLLCLTLVPIPLVAAPENDYPVSSWVEVEEVPNAPAGTTHGSTLMPYRDRKYNFGWMLGFGARSFKPEFFRSQFDESSFKDSFGQDDVRLGQFDLGFRYNSALGGLVLEFGYAGGGASNNDEELLRSFNVKQSYVGAKLILDSLWGEPYIAPYVGAGMISIQNEEIAAILTESETLSNSSSAAYYNMGFLVLLNWMDWISFRRGYDQGAVENYYLDFGVTQIMKSAKADSLDLSTGLLPSVGVRIEFY